MHGKREKKGSGATVQEQKALRLKLRMSTAAMHVLWKQSDVRDRQCVFNSAPLQMTAIRLDNRRETQKKKTLLSARNRPFIAMIPLLRNIGKKFAHQKWKTINKWIKATPNVRKGRRWRVMLRPPRAINALHQHKQTKRLWCRGMSLPLRMLHHRVYGSITHLSSRFHVVVAKSDTWRSSNIAHRA